MKKVLYLTLTAFFVFSNVYTITYAASPSAITDLVANSNVNSIDLKWSAPSASPSITDYIVSYRPYGDSSWTIFNDGTSTATSTTVTGLTNENYYEFKVEAVNDDGQAGESNVEIGVPLAESFSDDFEGYSVGSDISGQGGWVSGGSTSPYTIQSIDSSKVLGSTTGADCFTTNNVNNSIPGGATNVRIKVDFRYSGDGGVQPVIWMRRPGNANDAGGYISFRSTNNRAYLQRQPVNGGCALYQIGPSGTLMPLTTGSWYTAETDAVTLADGTVRIRFYIYPRGGTRGDALVAGIDDQGLYKNGTIFGLGRNTTTQVYYDNLHVYSAASVPPLPPIARDVSINGSSYITDGLQFSGNYTYGDANGDAEGTSTFRWLRSDTENGTYSAIPGATSSTYTPTEDDLGKYIKFEVTPVSTVSPTNGTPIVSTRVGPLVSSKYWGILITGQSHTTGHLSAPAISTSRHSWNTMPSDGLEGTDQYLDNLYESGQGENGDVETPGSGLANTFFDQNPKHPVFISIAGSNGYPYENIKKGTAIYSRALTQAQNAATDLFDNWSGSYTPKAVAVIHGESDWLNNTVNTYEANLLQLQSDYKTDLNAINSTNEEIPFFLIQTNTVTDGTMADVQLKAHEDNPGKMILVGPKYQFQTINDRVHYTNLGSRELGELMGKVMERVLVEGQTWNPLMPTSVVRNGQVITVSFNIPNPPLAIDTTNVAERANYGFEFSQENGNTVSISNVALSSDNTKVVITLSEVPTGNNQILKYAWTCPQNLTYWCSDPSNGDRIGGNIRDSDNYISPAFDSSGATLYNWLVAFSKPVTSSSPVSRPTTGTSQGTIQGFIKKGLVDPKNAAIQIPSTVTPALPNTNACVAYLPLTVRLSRGKVNDKNLVIKLQQFLNVRGIDSMLPATGFFGTKTDVAVRKFQMVYATDILTPLGLTKPTGIVAVKTIEKINNLACTQ